MSTPPTRKCPEEGCDVETDDGVDYLLDQMRHQEDRNIARVAELDQKLAPISSGLLALTTRPETLPEPEATAAPSPEPPETHTEHHEHGREGVMACPSCGGSLACPHCYKPIEPAQEESHDPTEPEAPQLDAGESRDPYAADSL